MDSSPSRSFFEPRDIGRGVQPALFGAAKAEGSCCVAGVETALFFIADIGRDGFNLSVISETLERNKRFGSECESTFW
jgi:hypothetical protein